jgi:hypothetical protein
MHIWAHYFTAGIVYSLIGSSSSAPDWVQRGGILMAEPPAS